MEVNSTRWPTFAWWDTSSPASKKQPVGKREYSLTSNSHTPVDFHYHRLLHQDHEISLFYEQRLRSTNFHAKVAGAFGTPSLVAIVGLSCIIFHYKQLKLDHHLLHTHGLDPAVAGVWGRARSTLVIQVCKRMGREIDIIKTSMSLCLSSRQPWKDELRKKNRFCRQCMWWWVHHIALPVWFHQACILQQNCRAQGVLCQRSESSDEDRCWSHQGRAMWPLWLFLGGSWCFDPFAKTQDSRERSYEDLAK